MLGVRSRHQVFPADPPEGKSQGPDLSVDTGANKVSAQLELCLGTEHKACPFPWSCPSLLPAVFPAAFSFHSFYFPYFHKKQCISVHMYKKQSIVEDTPALLPASFKIGYRHEKNPNFLVSLEIFFSTNML